MILMANLRNLIVAQRRARNLGIPTRSRSNSLPVFHFEPAESRVAVYQPNNPLLEELECSICKEDFGDEPSKQPRTIPCGHTFCTTCIGNLLFHAKKANCGKSKKCCPICRMSLKAQNISDVPVSFTIINIIQELRRNKSRPNCSQQECSMQSFGFCENHNSPKQFWCKSCCMWLCGACALLKHKEDNNGKCEITTVAEAIIAKKLIHEKEYLKVEETHATVTKSISDAIDICQSTKKLIKSDISILDKKLKEARLRYKEFESVQNKMRDLSSNVDEEWFRCNSLSAEVKQALEYTQLESAMTMFQTMQLRYLQKEFFIQLPYHIWSIRLLIECLLEHPQSIFYGEDFDDNVNQWLKVSIRWPDLCLHSARLDRPPSGAIIFNIDDVAERAHTFFLDLCYASDVDIRMKIQITDSSEYLPIFIDFCLGRKRRLFKGSKFASLEVDEETNSKVIWTGSQLEQCRSSEKSVEADQSSEQSNFIEEFSYGTLLEESCSHNDNDSEQNSAKLDIADSSSKSSRSNRTSCSSDTNFFSEVCSRRGSHSSITLQLPIEINKPENGCLRRVRSAVTHQAGSVFVRVVDVNTEKNLYQFGILINDAVISDTNYIDVGSVISGDFKFLTENLQPENIKQLIIKDCGFQIEGNSELYSKAQLMK